MPDPSEIKFTAEVYQVRTLPQDYGVRVTLDLPETAIPIMAMLAQARADGIPLEFTARVESSKPQKRRKTGGKNG